MSTRWWDPDTGEATYYKRESYVSKGGLTKAQIRAMVFAENANKIPFASQPHKSTAKAGKK